MRPTPLLALALGLGACSAPRRDYSLWPGALCDARFEEAAREVATASPLVVPRSRVLVDVQVDTGEMLRELEQAIPRRVAERRGLDIGDAGRLSFAVDRGPFGVRFDGEELFVEVDLRGEAEVCKPLGLLGCVGYASCSPRAHASAGLRLLLGRDYRLPPSRVMIPVTQPCTVTALGLDVTGEIQQQTNRQAAAIQARIDGALPELGPAVEGLWQALGTSVPLGGGACVRVAPREVVQTGLRQRGGVLSVGVGVGGEVVVESPCVRAVPAGPTPGPRLDPGAEPGIDLVFPAILGWPAVQLAVSRSLSAAEFRAGSEVIHVTDARVLPGPDGRLALGVVVAGRACGELWFEGSPALRDGAVSLGSLVPAPGQQELAHRAAPGLDLSALGAGIEGAVRVSLPVDMAALPGRIERLSARLLGGEAAGPLQPEIRVVMGPAAAEQALVRREGLVVLVRARGEVSVKVRPRPPG
jgi:hypothetical protein